MTSHHKHSSHKHRQAVKVHRFPLYRRSHAVAEEAPKEKEKEKEKKTEEKKEEATAPAPVWSAWEPIKDPQWDGYWRAKNDEDGKISVCPRKDSICDKEVCT